VKFLAFNQVVWAPVARSSFQERTQGISSSIPKGNNVGPMDISLCTSQISHPPLINQKQVQKQKKKKFHAFGLQGQLRGL
jgi:hypothetical protein